MIYKLLPEMITVVNTLDSMSVSGVLCGDEVPRSILWQRNGLFRLIPQPVVANAVDIYNIRFGKCDIVIRWEQGIDLDPKIAHILLGE